MAAIRNLLNPLLEDGNRFHRLPSPSSTVYTRDYSPPPPPPRKRQKVAKDAAVFTRSSIRGECRYPPCEHQDEMISAQHQRYEIYPIGHISEYPRHIPYNSEKKAFQEGTGRDSFEVFHYEFRVPGDDKVYCMMWDYNVGLVRTTPLFRCNGYSKTTPARMLNRNPGLREICHSITGGALVAQGYWMPFEAAKAVAATFCYHIRYALTPVFGTKFPEECLKPDSDRFGEMVIDESITRFCREEAICYRQIEIEKRARGDSTSRSTTPTEITKKHLRPKGKGSKHGYGTDDSGEATSRASTPSPGMCGYTGGWTPANTPRSIRNTTTEVEPCRKQGETISSPRKVLAGSARCNRKDQGDHRRGYPSGESFLNLTEFLSAPRQAQRNNIEAAASDVDCENCGSISGEDSAGDEKVAALSSGMEEPTRVGTGTVDTMLTDEKAAYLLISLKMGQTSLRGGANGQSILKRRWTSA